MLHHSLDVQSEPWGWESGEAAGEKEHNEAVFIKDKSNEPKKNKRTKIIANAKKTQCFNFER